MTRAGLTGDATIVPTSSLCLTGARERANPDRSHRSKVSYADLAAWLQRTREEERAALARELHDELGSILTAARMDLAWLQAQPLCQEADITRRLGALQSLLEQGMQLKRRVVEQLHPTLLDHLGLAAAAEHLILETRTRFTGVIEAHLDPRANINGSAGLALYRILQEALTNTQKYAEAQRIVVRLQQHPQHIALSIQDNGRGFRPEAVGWGHHGVAGMRQRMTAVHGQFDIESAPGAGTLIRAQVPLRTQHPSGTPWPFPDHTPPLPMRHPPQPPVADHR